MKALTRFRSELLDEDGSVLEVESVEAILNLARALDPGTSSNSKMYRSLHRLELILLQINDFCATVALCCGADIKSTGLLWGSLRVILAVSTIPK